MRYSLVLILALFISSHLFSQKTKNTSHKAPWSDTAFIVVNLQDTISGEKIIIIDIGQKATIYLKERLIKKRVTEQLAEDFKRAAFIKIINFLDSASLTSDTILINPFTQDFYDLDFIISEELQRGNAKVFYKKQNASVKIILHRLEKYGMYAHRFFYMPDKRPFFSVMEYSGIIENDKYHSDYNELLELANKLKSIREQ